MPESASPFVSQVRPKALLSSSLLGSPLNSHIIANIRTALSSRFDVELVEPAMLVQKPDFRGYAMLLYVGSALAEEIPLATMASMARLADVPTVFWATDDPYEFDARYRAEDFDIYLSNDRNAATHFIERDHVYHLPLAAGQTDHRPIMPFESRRIGAFFCGYHYESRRRIVADLLASPNFSRNDLVVMGGDWNVPWLQVAPSVKNHASLIDTYTLVKFVLNLGRTYDIANIHRKLVATTPGPRTFECGLAGTPQIYFCSSLEIEEYYRPETEIIVVETVEEAIDRMRWLRGHPTEWQLIALAAQRRTEAEHMYEHRITRLLELLDGVGAGIKKQSIA